MTFFFYPICQGNNFFQKLNLLMALRKNEYPQILLFNLFSELMCKFLVSVPKKSCWHPTDLIGCSEMELSGWEVFYRVFGGCTSCVFRKLYDRGFICGKIYLFCFVSDQNLCDLRGCCWSPQDDTRVPWCYFSSNHGYKTGGQLQSTPQGEFTHQELGKHRSE